MPECLAKHDVQATFFVTGMVAERVPQPIAEISQTAEGDGLKQCLKGDICHLVAQQDAILAF